MHSRCGSPKNVKVTKGREFLGRFQRSDNSERRWCTKCGGHVLTHHPVWGITDVYAATIPSLTFTPALHVNYAETVLRMKDGLPKLKDFPAELGGSGAACPSSVSDDTQGDSGRAMSPRVLADAMATVILEHHFEGRSFDIERFNAAQRRQRAVSRGSWCAPCRELRDARRSYG